MEKQLGGKVGEGWRSGEDEKLEREKQCVGPDEESESYSKVCC